LIRVINFALNMGLLPTHRFLDDWFLFVFEHDHNFHELFGKLARQGNISHLLEVRYDYPRACWARTRAHALTLVAQKLMPVQEFCNTTLGS